MTFEGFEHLKSEFDPLKIKFFRSAVCGVNHKIGFKEFIL